jgi:hypothetical protein
VFPDFLPITLILIWQWREAVSEVSVELSVRAQERESG